MRYLLAARASFVPPKPRPPYAKSANMAEKAKGHTSVRVMCPLANCIMVMPVYGKADLVNARSHADSQNQSGDHLSPSLRITLNPFTNGSLWFAHIPRQPFV